MKPTLLKILFSIICILTTAFTLNLYATFIQHLLSIKYNWMFELIMILGMLLFQLMFVYKKNIHTIITYFSRMLFVSLVGSILLWPLLITNKYYNLTDVVNVGYFLLVVVAMFFIHKNIVTKMKLPSYLSYAYILYRFIILLYII